MPGPPTSGIEADDGSRGNPRRRTCLSIRNTTVWVPKRGIGGMPTVMAIGLARSRACDGTDAVSDIRSAGRMDGAAGAFGRIEGRRAAGAAPGGHGAAAAEPETEAGLGRPGGARCPGAAAPEAAADEPPGHAGHAAALAPASGPLAVDLSPPRRPAAGRCQGRGADRADGSGEPGLGIQADPRRTARPRVPGRDIDGAPGAEAAADAARTAAQPDYLAAVPAHAGRHDAGVRFLHRRLRRYLAARLRVLRDRGGHPPCPCPGRDRAPGRGVDGAAGTEPADGPGRPGRPVPVPGPRPGPGSSP